MNPSQNRPRILFFAPILEYPSVGGPTISVINALKSLSRVSEVVIVTTVSRQKLGKEAHDYFRKYSSVIEFAPSAFLNSTNPKLDSILRKIRRLLSPILGVWDALYVKRAGRRHSVDIYWIDRILEHAFFVFRELRRFLPDEKIVADTEAVYSRFVLRELPFVKSRLRRLWVSFQGRRKLGQEDGMVRLASAVTAVSKLDAEYYQSIAPVPEKVHLFSNVIDLDEFAPVAQEPFALKKPALLLLGTYGHVNSPMDRAALWLIEEIMPLVVQQVPEAHLYIVGKNSELTLKQHENHAVTVAGRVRSVMPYLRQSSISLVPLRFESGTRFKILESGAASVPCVSTELGAEGIPVTPGQDIEIAETTDEFVHAIIKLLKNPELAKSRGENLHQLIRRDYSIETQTRDAQVILRFLRGSGDEVTST